jgi:hypothetical protein
MKSEIEEIAYKKVNVRDGDTKRQVTLFEANVLAHAMKGAKGDHRSSALLFGLTAKTGLLDRPDEQRIGGRIWRPGTGADGERLATKQRLIEESRS